MEITINLKQAIAVVWTLIAVGLSLVVVIAMDFPYSVNGMTISNPSMPWWFTIAVFFGVLILITLPVYLLIALWSIVSRWETD